MLAAGIEFVLTHVHDPRAGVSGVLVLAGPMDYLLSQAIYFRAETGTGSRRTPWPHCWWSSSSRWSSTSPDTQDT